MSIVLPVPRWKAIDQRIPRLDVPVHYARGVQRVECRQQAIAQLDRRGDMHRGREGIVRGLAAIDVFETEPLLQGQALNPAKAKAAGVIDEVVPAAELLSAAKAWVLGATDADLVKGWDKKGYKVPGGTPYHPAGFPTFVGASAMVHANTWGVYPAAKALLSAVYEGLQVPFDTALKIEARWFTHVLLVP